MIKFMLLIVTLFSGLSFSQTINTAKIDSLLNLLSSSNKVSGSISISKGGTNVYKKPFGFSYIKDGILIPSNDSTKYRIGSITKIFTATMIFQLIDEGKLSLSSPLSKFFPKIPNAEKITLSNLLYHRSGIHNFTDDKEYLDYMVHPKTRDEMLAIISKRKPDFKPDQKTSYSNSNFILLGYIIEQVTQKSYEQNLTERITSKIGLPNTYTGKKIDYNKNESGSFKFENQWIQLPETDMSIPGGAGAIVSTPSDMTRFIEALFSCKLTSKESLNQMQTLKDGFGMGLIPIPFYKKSGFGHNGVIDGFASILAYFPEDSLSIAFCCNGVNYLFNDILIGILKIYFNDEYKLPDFTVITLKPEVLDKYTGIYSSKQLPLKITISKNKSQLFGQATGQASFPLTPSSQNIFKFEQAGIVMEFNTEKNEMILNQNGGTYLFIREK